MPTTVSGTFRFLELPTEIRLKIYEEYFEGSQILIQDIGVHDSGEPDFQEWEQRPNHYWEVLHEGAEAIGYSKTRNLPMALTHTSSQVRAESRPILAAATHLYILGLEIPVVLHLVPAYFRFRIKHLTVSMEGSIQGYQRFRLQLLEPADLPSLETLTMHYDATSEYGPELRFPLEPGFDKLKHYNDFRADPLSLDKFRHRMRDLRVPFNALEQLSQVAPFHVKLRVHTLRGWWRDMYDNKPRRCACLLIVFDMRIKEITQIHVDMSKYMANHTSIWPYIAYVQPNEEAHGCIL